MSISFFFRPYDCADGLFKTLAIAKAIKNAPKHFPNNLEGRTDAKYAPVKDKMSAGAITQKMPFVCNK